MRYLEDQLEPILNSAPCAPRNWGYIQSGLKLKIRLRMRKYMIQTLSRIQEETLLWLMQLVISVISQLPAFMQERVASKAVHLSAK